MPTATGFAAMLADALPEPWRWDEKTRAVCLRIAHFMDAVAPLVMTEGDAQEPDNHVDQGLTAGLRGEA